MVDVPCARLLAEAPRGRGADGVREVAAQQPETYLAVPRCLLRLHERARGEPRVAGSFAGAWLEFELEAERWGRRGGLTVLGRYGTEWFALLALRRWGRITAADLDAARPLR